MKHVLIILIVALGLAIVVSVFRGATTPPVPEGFTTELPTAVSQESPAETLRLASGQTVQNFLTNGETVADVVNPGHYLLAGSVGYCLADGTCPEGFATDSFVISYHENQSQFAVGILAEPIGTVRQEAEAFLIDRLGIEPAVLCELNATVLVPVGLNPDVVGEIGFSVCADSLPL